jgi:hypothetical protein
LRVSPEEAIGEGRGLRPGLSSGRWSASWVPADNGISGFYWVSYKIDKMGASAWTVEPPEGYKPLQITVQDERHRKLVTSASILRRNRKGTDQ